jgi:hypothetical protein
MHPARDRHDDIAETIGRFRTTLGSIAEGGPNAGGAYVQLREELVANERVRPLLPDFVIECRTPRDFWNYIQPAFASYAERSRYVQAQLVPVERQFRPERDRATGVRPPEVRIEYSPVVPVTAAAAILVGEQRIAELRTLQSPNFDFARVVRLCEELNVAYANGCYMAVAALTRALLDHIPPIFGQPAFAQVASNHDGQAFKNAMQRLQTSARAIADGHLHQPIRRRETLPLAQQVNFAAEIDVLLAEVVRLSV